MTGISAAARVHIYLWALGVVLLIGTAGCGGSSNSGSATGSKTTISGQAVQNGMDGATIEAFTVKLSDAGNDQLVGSTVADSAGNYTLKLRPAPSGPVRVTASGGTFVSEANGATIAAPSTISALLEKVRAGQSVNLNPLTDFVNSQTVGAVVNSRVEFSTALRNANTAIQGDFDLTSDPSTLTPNYTAGGIGTDAGKLGLVLGAIINEDQLLCPSAPGGLAAALSADLADGVFEGQSFGTPVAYCGGDLAAIAGTSELQDAMSGLQQFGTQVTSAFSYGGIGNVLTANGIEASQLLGPLATLNPALANAAPASVNSFAAAGDTVSMNTARSIATATLLPNGKVLIAGGRDVNSNALSSTELYDPASNSFAAPGDTASMNTARAYATATLLPNGKVLIAGGAGSGVTVLGSTELYDPASNSFAAPADTASMNTVRALATATLLPNGKVLIAGGTTDANGTVVSSTELYDPANNSFAAPADTAAMNTAREAATATLLPNGKALIAGGFGSGRSLSSTELYDPASNSFAAVGATAAMNTARYFATATLLPNGKALIAGGNGGSNPLGSTELYDPASNSFAAPGATAAMNTAREFAPATLSPNGKVLIAGGLGIGIGAFLSSTELYDPASNSFAAPGGTGALNTAREAATATLLPNGKVLIAGGQGLSTVASTDLYTP